MIINCVLHSKRSKSLSFKRHVKYIPKPYMNSVTDFGSQLAKKIDLTECLRGF